MERLTINRVEILGRVGTDPKVAAAGQTRIARFPVATNEHYKDRNGMLRQEKMEAFGRLLDVMDELRKKCPWDRKQTNESLRPNTIEETYELCDALIKEDNLNICKEESETAVAPGGFR